MLIANNGIYISEVNITMAVISLIGTKWKFKDTISIETPQAGQASWSINGNAYNDDYVITKFNDTMYVNFITDSHVQLFYDGTTDKYPNFRYYAEGGWKYTASSTATAVETDAPMLEITSGSDVTNANLITWLYANADIVNTLVDKPSLLHYTEIVKGRLAAKQDKLVSGTNIATINNTSLLNGGNISISADNIFTAVYDSTSYADVFAAYTAGKLVQMFYQGHRLLMTYYNSTANSFTFGVTDNIGSSEMISIFLSQESGWDDPKTERVLVSSPSSTTSDPVLVGLDESSEQTSVSVGDGLSLVDGVLSASSSGGPTWKTVTIAASSWTASGNVYTYSYADSDVTADTNITCGANVATSDYATLFGAYMSAQAAGSVTFTALTLPTESITFIYTLQN